MFNISLNNLRSGDECHLNIMLTADESAPYRGQLTLGKSMCLAALRIQFPDLRFSIDYISAGRLYIGYGVLPAAPVPNGKQYYGWIELTHGQADACVWINLSNVDIVGLPLALCGFTPSKACWSLGYRRSITAIISDLKERALIGENPKGAMIHCTTEKANYSPSKIVAPNIASDSYASYSAYIAALREANARLIITTDTPFGGTAKIFTGSFVAAPPSPGRESPTNTAISLTSAEGDTFVVHIGQLTSAIIYGCGGGTLIYNGHSVSQNQAASSTTPTPEEVYANSTFRNIMVGLNEGYFVTTGDNYSANFPYLTPFHRGHGSSYADIIHANSNSYGFPYADSNLKVQIQASPTDPITLTIATDDTPTGYSPPSPGNGNQPLSGAYQFSIGTGSGSLGTITIGNCAYLPDAQGAYSGFLPTLSEWTRMHFSGPDKYIWFKTTGAGFLAGVDCFNCGGSPFAGPIVFDEQCATWPADVSWNPAKSSPLKPSD